MTGRLMAGCTRLRTHFHIGVPEGKRQFSINIYGSSDQAGTAKNKSISTDVMFWYVSIIVIDVSEFDHIFTTTILHSRCKPIWFNQSAKKSISCSITKLYNSLPFGVVRWPGGIRLAWLGLKSHSDFNFLFVNFSNQFYSNCLFSTLKRCNCTPHLRRDWYAAETTLYYNYFLLCNPLRWCAGELRWNGEI